MKSINRSIDFSQRLPFTSVGACASQAKKHSHPATVIHHLFRFPSFMRILLMAKLSESRPGFFRKRQQGLYLLKVIIKSEAGDGPSAAGTETPRGGEPAPVLEHKVPSHDQPTRHLFSSPP